MQDQEKADIVRNAYACFERGDIDEMVALMRPDVLWDVRRIDHIPQSGQRVGHEGVREFFRLLASHQRPIAFEVRSFEVEGDRVMVGGFYEWHVVDTGRNDRSDWKHRFVFRDGLVASFQEQFDVEAAKSAYQLAVKNSALRESAVSNLLAPRRVVPQMSSLMSSASKPGSTQSLKRRRLAYRSIS
ncbi:MAG: nuclear transport factor 2 family protein [Gemmataceae bacterium]